MEIMAVGVNLAVRSIVLKLEVDRLLQRVSMFQLLHYNVLNYPVILNIPLPPILPPHSSMVSLD
jgi:hypothetical protein